jgi:hypothetical protein
MFKEYIDFLSNPAWTRFLDSSWTGKGYINPSTNCPPDSVAVLKLSLYHLYSALMGLPGFHAERCQILVPLVAEAVTEEGALRFYEERTHHPAHCSFAAEALGAAAFYGKQIGLSDKTIALAEAAMSRIIFQNPRIRPPAGTAGRTQQMRFETVAFYWYWRVTCLNEQREHFFELFNNCVDRYTHAFAYEGGYTQPAIHPDWTWNYASSSGTTTELATNTHTPIYYLAEQSGFLFAYMHGLKTGCLKRNPEWDKFATGYISGLFRNYSRAGHMASDVDGYGVHRAWYGSLLIEAAPFDGAAACSDLKISHDWASWLNWYVGRHLDFIRRGDDFDKTGMPTHCPYGHRITIEKQFNVLAGSKFYASLARACFEYAEIPDAAACPPPAFSDHAWWQQWVRVSTPTYETSTVAATSLRNIPLVKHFGDPHLGTLHGGCPVATLMVGDQLMYATSNTHAGLWHIELTDVNGKVHRSSGTGFDDEIFFGATNAEGEICSSEQYPDYAICTQQPLKDLPRHTIWRKNISPEQIAFWTQHQFRDKDFSFKWGYRARAGFYLATATFHFPIPATMNPQATFGKGLWQDIKAGDQWKACPTGFRWSDGKAAVEVALTPAVPLPDTAQTSCIAIPTTAGNPGGENSFCPYPLLSLQVIIPNTHEMAFLTIVKPLLSKVNIGL